MAEQLVFDFYVAPENDIGKALEKHESRYNWTPYAHGEDSSECGDIAHASQLESMGFSLTTENPGSERSDHTGRIVTPDGRVLDTDEIKALSEKHPFDPDSKFSKLIHNAYMYALLSDCF